MIRLLAMSAALLIANPARAVAMAWVEACPMAESPIRSEWCTENIRLPVETSAQPGNYDLEDRAYLREIIDSVDHADIRKITFIGATQIGKTELIKAIILSQGEVARAPMLFAGPDQVYVREQRDLIYRTAEASPAIRHRIPEPRYRNDRWIDLEKCLVYQAWSGSTQRLSGRACKVVLCSEVDRWQSSPLLAEERVKAFPDNSCVIYEGTPRDASPSLEDSYKQSDRRTFRVPCPHCGEYQELRFFPHRAGPYAGRGGVAGLKDDKGNWLRPDEARRAAYYICERNGCRIEQAEKGEMIRRGIWAREGELVTKAGKITGKPENPCRHAGFRINSLYSPTITLGDAAEKYLTVRDTTDGLTRFFNDWLGLGFTPRGKTPRWKDLGERLAADHPRGAVPRGAYFLTGTSDVQARGVYWVVRAWGPHKTSWLVDWGYLARDAVAATEDDSEELAEERLSSDLEKLDEAVLHRQWPVLGENPLGLSQLKIRLLGCDCGYRPTDVYAYTRARPGKRVIPVRGDPRIAPGQLYRPSKIERNARTGRVYPEGLEAWGIDTSAYKTEIADRWAADRTQPGVWWLPRDILTTPGGEDYLRQVTSEGRAIEMVRGRKIIRWQPLSNTLDNHYWDCEVYAACLADMITGNCWDEAVWKTWQPKPKPTSSQPEGSEIAARERQQEHQEDFSAR